MEKTQVLIIGCGIAGCSAALLLAEQGIDVLMVSAGEDPYISNSSMAQGGIVSLSSDDAPELIYNDLIEAGDGLCNPKAVRFFAEEGPRLAQQLLIEKWQVPFSRDNHGELMYTREAVHSRSRIIYNADETGKAIMQALLQKIAKEPYITLKTGHTAVDLITLSHHSSQKTDIYAPLTCCGAYVLDHKNGQVRMLLAQKTILATGGVGELFIHTTNSKVARGDGIAMAFRAGARIMNMEYIQFHPTSLYVPMQRRMLLTEALRGEGAKLLSYAGVPFMQTVDPRGDLAPRDVVARAIYQEMLKTEAPHVWLDISHRDGTYIKERFPFVDTTCSRFGFDCTKEPLPVVPAAHYSCGGIAVDLEGRTSVQQLYAIGEVACNGLHGANRLASTSLLEGVLFSKLAADHIAKTLTDQNPFPPVEEWTMGGEPVDPSLIAQDWVTLKQTMWNYVGLVRDKKRLSRALVMLEDLKRQIDSFYEEAILTPELVGLRNGILTALLIAQRAYRNRSSCGSHYRIN